MELTGLEIIMGGAILSGVEDQGQEMYQVGTDESGGPVYLGMMAGVGMAAVEPVVEEG